MTNSSLPVWVGLAIVLGGASLFGGIAPSQLDCKLVEKVAKKVITIRENDLPQYLAAEATAPLDFESLEDAVVIDAYRMKVEKGAEKREKAINWFSSMYASVCEAYNLGVIPAPDYRKTGLDYMLSRGR